jgi:hypothetical protein
MSVQMTIKETAHYTHSMEDIWALCGAPGGIDKWLPAVEKSRIDDDVRYAELAGGAGQAPQRITEHNDALHYYDYDYIDGPLVLEAFSASRSSPRRMGTPTSSGQRSSRPRMRSEVASWPRPSVACTRTVCRGSAKFSTPVGRVSNRSVRSPLHTTRSRGD